MTQEMVTREDLYREAFDAFSRNSASEDETWLRELRERAMSRFMELGFPTARRGNEEWKYTDVRPIAREAFSLPEKPGPGPGAEELRWITFGEKRWHQLVFVDGAFSPELSWVDRLPSGVEAADLSDVLRRDGSILRQHLAQRMPFEDNAFVALNTAFVHHGAFLYIPDRVRVEEPIHVVFVNTQGQETVTYPRVLIVTGRDSSATVVQSYAALDESRYLSNAVSEIVLGRGSLLKQYTVQRHSEQAYHIANTQAVVTANSRFSSVNFDFGGGLVRNNLNVLMAEEEGQCLLNGLYMPTGTQHVDNQVIIDHAKGYTGASELYKGILNGRARSVFHGSIIVREHAAKVDASQEDKNLLLSSRAEADTKPAFWIYCDDVKCKHGAACGQIDEDALFYLRSRGLSDATARRLLVSGFVTEIIDSVEHEGLRDHVSDLVHARLSDWLGHEE